MATPRRRTEGAVMLTAVVPAAAAGTGREGRGYSFLTPTIPLVPEPEHTPPPPPPSPSRYQLPSTHEYTMSDSSSSSSSYDYDNNTSSDASVYTAPSSPRECSPFASLQKRLHDISVRNFTLLRRARRAHAEMVMRVRNAEPLKPPSPLVVESPPLTTTCCNEESPPTSHATVPPLPPPSPPPPSPSSSATCTPLDTSPCAPAPEAVPESLLQEEVRALVARVLASVV